MKITLLCNCGLAIEAGGETLLVDALTRPLAPFFHTPESIRAQIIEGRGDYQNVCALFFTHLHPDHFDHDAAEEFSAHHPGATVHIPRRTGAASQSFQAGSFSVVCRRARHTKVEGFGASTVETLFIRAEGKTVYLASDCAPEPSLHARLLQGQVVDAAFWNPEALCYMEMWPVLQSCARQSFIYHLPPDPHEPLRRKLARVMARYPEALSNVTLLQNYPTVLEL